MLSPPAAALAAASLTLGATVLTAVTSGRTAPPPVPVDLAVVPADPQFPMPVLRPDVSAYRMPVLTPDPDRFPMPVVPMPVVPMPVVPIAEPTPSAENGGS